MDKEHQLPLLREAGEWLDRLKEPDAPTYIGFEAWLARDPEHLKIIRQLQALNGAIRVAVAEHPEIRALDHKADVVTFPVPYREESLGAAGELPLLAFDRRDHGGRSWLRATLAAVAASLLLAVGLFFFHGGTTTIYETQGSRALFTLEDDSLLHLNAHTRVLVRMFPHARELVLAQGEAKFEVTHDPSRPFRVESHGAMAEALGTSFDVKLLDNGDVAVLVEEGRVAVSSHHAVPQRAHAIELRRSQSVRIHFEKRFAEATLNVEQLSARDLRLALAWAGWATFSGETLREAVNRLIDSLTTGAAPADV